MVVWGTSLTYVFTITPAIVLPIVHPIANS